MLGIIFTLLGGYTVYRLWGDHTFLAIIVGLATIYQMSSLREMFKEKQGLQPGDRIQTTINIVSSLVIIVFLVISFLF